MSASKRNQTGRNSGSHSPGLNRGYAIFAIVTVAALVIGGVAFVIQDLTNSNSSAPIVVDPEVDELEQQLQRAIDANPSDVQAVENLANYLANTGRIEQAIPLFENAIALAPNDVALRLDFARSLAGSDKRADAEVQFQKVIAAEPSNAEAHFYLGQLYASWAPPRTEDAVTAYLKTLALDPLSFVAERAGEELANLGVVYPGPASPVGTPE